jgi:hypothetical protein
VSVFVLDASCTLTWCFLDRATPNTDATLRRLEAAVDNAIVPSIWPIEVANALGKGVVRRKLKADRAQEIWEELALLPIRQSGILLEVPKLLELDWINRNDPITAATATRVLRESWAVLAPVDCLIASI